MKDLDKPTVGPVHLQLFRPSVIRGPWLTLFQPGGTDYVHHITTRPHPSGLSDLPAALVFTVFLHAQSRLASARSADPRGVSLSLPVDCSLDSLGSTAQAAAAVVVDSATRQSPPPNQYIRFRANTR